jgi:hypothetical protein
MIGKADMTRENQTNTAPHNLLTGVGVLAALLLTANADADLGGASQQAFNLSASGEFDTNRQCSPILLRITFGWRL